MQALALASRDRPFTNSLGMLFVPVPGTQVLFCLRETRVRDYAAYAHVQGDVDESWRSPGFREDGNHPVVNVNWTEADAYCRWLTLPEHTRGSLPRTHAYRLPRDAEWSLAVGLSGEVGDSPESKDQRIQDLFPWGRSWPPPSDGGNYDDCSPSRIDRFRDGYERTAPVGSFGANAHGLHDLGGSVWEWCEDWYNARRCVRVLRGASWGLNVRESLWSSTRFYGTPVCRFNSIGFRVVLEGGVGSR